MGWDERLVTFFWDFFDICADRVLTESLQSAAMPDVRLQVLQLVARHNKKPYPNHLSLTAAASSAKDGDGGEGEGGCNTEVEALP